MWLSVGLRARAFNFFAQAVLIPPGASFVLVLVILGVGYSLAVGATLAGIVYFLSTTSGGHVNPAVSLAMWLRGAIDTEKFISYIVAQCAGAATAYDVARVVNF